MNRLTRNYWLSWLSAAVLLSSFFRTPLAGAISDWETPPLKSMWAKDGHSSTALSNLSTLNPKNYANYQRTFYLKDGTRVGGLLLSKKNKGPLLIGTFGFLADRWSAPVAQFINKVHPYLSENIHILILDHPTSSPFYMLNNSLSIGGYDEGRMIVEIAEQILRSDEYSNFAKKITSVHLIGISMGANGVINALMESQRLGKNLFQSGITFSGALNYAEVPANTLQAFVKNGSRNPWSVFKAPTTDWVVHAGLEEVFNHAIKVAQSMGPKGYFPLESQTAGSFVYSEFQKRLDFLSHHVANQDPTWNPAIQTQSLVSYIKTSLLVPAMKSLRTHLTIVHAGDDPVVPVEEFADVEKATAMNLNIETLYTPYGGHWAFSGTYGGEWVAKKIEKSFLPSRISLLYGAE